MKRWNDQRRPGTPTFARWLIVSAWAVSVAAEAAPAPVVSSIARQSGEVVVVATVPPGFRHAVLESGETLTLDAAGREVTVAGELNGSAASVTFRIPDPHATRFLRVRVGSDPQVPAARHAGHPFYSVEYGAGGGPLSAEEQAGHVLNRLAYGPTREDLASIDSIGVTAYIERQLAPASLDEASNAALRVREAAFFNAYQPREEKPWVAAGDLWRYFKGTQAPPTGWNQPDFNDAGWLSGPSGFGYGDGDDATVLTDMQQTDGQPGYLTIFLRKRFLAEIADLDALILRMDFDDGFVAYLNGTEVARANVTGTPPPYNRTASSDHEAGEPVEYDLSSRRALLRDGENVLAVQVHNINLTSSDLSAIPELVARRNLPLPTQQRIRDVASLQQLAHVRGIHARRQLQAVLGEFWENHFTTDHDKVAEYLADLRNSNARPAMSAAQASAEAAHMEHEEYAFFHEHALGNFGDLLLYSATSPSQLIYLDNVLNVKGAPNENYAREIFELFAFGVDNRYTQTDIEQLARCFTGWTIRKVWPDQKPAFPASARTPPSTGSVQFEDTVVLDLGPGWKYFKGTREPSPGPNNSPGIDWTKPDFTPTGWLNGATGIGYGDGDDATVLSDMRNQYLSVYLRREFTVQDPSDLGNLLLSVDYDDGFVAYLNGEEVARSATLASAGTPPPFNRPASGNHEVTGIPEIFSLRDHRQRLRAAPEKNVLAIQVHNVTRDSSDLSLLPRLVVRQSLPGSIENGDPNGVWTFRFDPAQHDIGPKTLFAGTPFQRVIPGGRTGLDGLLDAVEVIDSLVDHPSTAEFIAVKLVNRFVSDEISLSSYHARTAPAGLLELVDDAVAAWHSTKPAGNIATVLRAILRPADRTGAFWVRENFRAKVKTPIEYINSSVRALGADVSGTTLASRNEELGMHLFTRDDPDGWSESGLDWIDTGTLLARLRFARALTSNGIANVRWNVNAWLAANNLGSAESIVDHFDRLLFHGAMSPSNRALLLRYATTDDAGRPVPLDPQRTDYATRVRQLVALILAMPTWNFQ